jgi:hypothetical protein
MQGNYIKKDSELALLLQEMKDNAIVKNDQMAQINLKLLTSLIEREIIVAQSVILDECLEKTKQTLQS